MIEDDDVFFTTFWDNIDRLRHHAKIQNSDIGLVPLRRLLSDTIVDPDSTDPIFNFLCHPPYDCITGLSWALVKYLDWYNTPLLRDNGIETAFVNVGTCRMVLSARKVGKLERVSLVGTQPIYEYLYECRLFDDSGIMRNICLIKADAVWTNTILMSVFSTSIMFEYLIEEAIKWRVDQYRELFGADN